MDRAFLRPDPRWTTDYGVNHTATTRTFVMAQYQSNPPSQRSGRRPAIYYHTADDRGPQNYLYGST